MKKFRLLNDFWNASYFFISGADFCNLWRIRNLERKITLINRNLTAKTMVSLPLTFKFKKIRGRNFSVFHDIWKFLFFFFSKNENERERSRAFWRAIGRDSGDTGRSHMQLCFRGTWNNCGKSSRGSLIVNAQVFIILQHTPLSRFIGQRELIFSNRSQSKDDKLLLSEIPSGDNAVSC